MAAAEMVSQRFFFQAKTFSYQTISNRKNKITNKPQTFQNIPYIPFSNLKYSKLTPFPLIGRKKLNLVSSRSLCCVETLNSMWTSPLPHHSHHKLQINPHKTLQILSDKQKTHKKPLLLFFLCPLPFVFFSLSFDAFGNTKTIKKKDAKYGAGEAGSRYIHYRGRSG